MYKPKELLFPVVNKGKVRNIGGTLNLGMNELAAVNIKEATRKDGMKVVEDMTTLKDDDLIRFAMGVPDNGFGRSEDNKPIYTMPFTIKDIKDIYVDEPLRSGAEVDDFIIGYHGPDGSEIDLDNGEAETIEITLKNGMIGVTGMPKGEHTIRTTITAPNEGVKGEDWTMEELVTDAVRDLKNRELPGRVPVSTFAEIMPVNSENPDTVPDSSTQTTYELHVRDEGRYTNLGDIQASYPEMEIRRLNHKDGVTTYTTISDSLPDQFELERTTSMIKGCDDCPPEYLSLTDAYIYQVSVNEDGADHAATFNPLFSTRRANSTSENTTIDGRVYYTFAANDTVSDSEVQALKDAIPSAEIELLNEDRSINTVCKKEDNVTYDWVEGESCTYTEDTYTITLADDKCGDSRLNELREAYPELTISTVTDSAQNCQRTYQASVKTSVVCEECSPEFRDLFESEAPQRYDNVNWVKEKPTYSGTAKMGIRVRSKVSILSGTENYIDDMPFVYTSAEISLVGGFRETPSESYNHGTNGRFDVKVLSTKADPQNLGGNFRRKEHESMIHFRGAPRHCDNFSRAVLGEETTFEGLSQYLVYYVTVAPVNTTNNFQQPQTNAYTYGFPVKLGMQGEMEDLFSEVAEIAGLPAPRSIYRKDLA